MKQKLISDKTYESYVNDRSVEMFGKGEHLLTPIERLRLDEYIYDYTNPIWKPIVIDGFQTNAQISNVGLVRQMNGIIKKSFSHNGYQTISIRILMPDKNISKTIGVHRLVAQAFIPNPENKPEVNHINADPSFNWVGNLEWCTHLENIQHSVRLGNHICGTDHVNSKCTDMQIRDACKLLEKDELPVTEISKITGVPERTLWHIRMDGGWKHIASDYNISSRVKSKGPRYSILSYNIIDMINLGYDNEKIISTIKDANLAENITNKAISDRIYHIRKMIENNTLNDYRPTRLCGERP